MPRELSRKESAAVMANATDIRPTEHIGPEPHTEKGMRKGDELSLEESAAILRIAVDVRPGENFHPDED